MSGSGAGHAAGDVGVDAGLLARLCQAGVRSVPGTGAAVSLVTRAGLRATVHATDLVAARLEDLQFELGEGPSIDALLDRLPVLVSDMDDPRTDAGGRWPAFTPAALDAGARAVFVFPMLLGTADLGVLLLHCDYPAVLDAGQQARLRLAEAAFHVVLDMLSGSPSSLTINAEGVWLGSNATLDRAEIYQAAGMATIQLGVAIEDAMVRLRAYAFATGRALIDVARDVVGRRLSLDDDTDEQRSGAEELP
jgi:hypothetical protein